MLCKAKILLIAPLQAMKLLLVASALALALATGAGAAESSALPRRMLKQAPVHVINPWDLGIRCMAYNLQASNIALRPQLPFDAHDVLLMCMRSYPDLHVPVGTQVQFVWQVSLLQHVAVCSPATSTERMHLPV